jgi:hypothetical protein
LTVANVSLAVAAIYTRMSTQQTWRRRLNARVLDRWITGGRYYQLGFISGDHANPEYRVADDLRVSVDAPVDFAVGLLQRGDVHARSGEPGTPDEPIVTSTISSPCLLSTASSIARWI